MPAVRDYVTRRLARRCRAAGPAFNTRFVFGRPLIRPDDVQRLVVERLSHLDIRKTVANYLTEIRRTVGFAKELHIVNMLLFLTHNASRLRSNQTQLNAYRAIAQQYGRVGLFALVVAHDFLAVTE